MKMRAREMGPGTIDLGRFRFDRTSLFEKLGLEKKGISCD